VYVVPRCFKANLVLWNRGVQGWQRSFTNYGNIPSRPETFLHSILNRGVWDIVADCASLSSVLGRILSDRPHDIFSSCSVHSHMSIHDWQRLAYASCPSPLFESGVSCEGLCTSVTDSIKSPRRPCPLRMAAHCRALAMVSGC